MSKKLLTFIVILVLLTPKLWAQKYERYRSHTDTLLHSAHLGFDKKISVLVPVEWQKNSKSKFPLILIFDRQNRRSNGFILNAIDYLTANEQMPSSIIISIESEQKYRYRETQYKISDANGLAAENEQFIFNELIPLAEKQYHAGAFRLLIGHSRYGYFTSALFASRINDLSAVISMSPFIEQEKVNLADSVAKLGRRVIRNKKYYRYGIGNDYPEDFTKLHSVTGNLKKDMLDVRGTHYKQADHNVTPGLLITNSLYEIFENWSAIQAKYISNQQKDLAIKPALERQIQSEYGENINLSLGVLNGKGWYFYNEEQYSKAIEAWKILLDTYPNFSEAYLSILEAQVKLKQNTSETLKQFKQSLSDSEFYNESEKNQLEKELQKLLR